MIMSLLIRFKPNECKLILIDPFENIFIDASHKPKQSPCFKMGSERNEKLFQKQKMIFQSLEKKFLGF